jgi:hypothetical protein
MIERARARNAVHIAAGKAILHTAAFEPDAFAGRDFDKIFAVNVNLFWTGPAVRELTLARRLLRPGGALYLSYEPPGPDQVRRLAGKLVGHLAAAGFATTTTIAATSGGAALLCVAGVRDPGA